MRFKVNHNTHLNTRRIDGAWRLSKKNGQSRSGFSPLHDIVGPADAALRGKSPCRRRGNGGDCCKGKYNCFHVIIPPTNDFYVYTTIPSDWSRVTPLLPYTRDYGVCPHSHATSSKEMKSDIMQLLTHNYVKTIWRRIFSSIPKHLGARRVVAVATLPRAWRGIVIGRQFKPGI